MGFIFKVKMRQRGYPETSVMIYHYSLRNNPEERSSYLLRGGSLNVTSVRMAFPLLI